MYHEGKEGSSSGVWDYSKVLGLNDALDCITCEELGVTNKNFINLVRR